jgi:hypothetical protein
MFRLSEPGIFDCNHRFWRRLKELTNLEIYNSAGMLRGRTVYKKGTINAIIDVSALSAGIYLLNFYGEGGHFIKQLSVTR